MKSSKLYTLKNGLSLIFYQDTSKYSTYAELIVNYGAINNEFILDNKIIRKINNDDYSVKLVFPCDSYNNKSKFIVIR